MVENFEEEKNNSIEVEIISTKISSKTFLFPLLSFLFHEELEKNIKNYFRKIFIKWWW